MSKLCLLLLLPVADARLRGFKVQDAPMAKAPAQETPPTILCDQQPSSEPETLHSEFDEFALFQRKMTPSQGMHHKSAEEWLAELDDHETKISASETVLHNDTVAGQLSRLNSEGCADDPMWRDADGDGCEIYRFAIESGRGTRDSICNGGGEVPPTRALRGAITLVGDATAKIFCPATCGMCPPASIASAAAEQSGDGLDDVSFLQVGVSSSGGVPRKSAKSWEERQDSGAYESRITHDQQVVDSEAVAFQVSKLQKGEGCADDPMWRDADGDGCEIYKFVVESGKSTRELICNGGGFNPPSVALRGGSPGFTADATARIFCPVTCGAC